PTIPRTGRGRAALGPLRSTARVDHSALDLQVHTPPRAPVAEVKARPYPQAYGKIDGGWSPLQQSGQSGHRWSGQVDVSDLPPGRHKLEVRAVGENGDLYDDVAELELPSTTAQIGWRTRLDGRIQGGLAERDGLVVAATTKGEVQAFEATGRSERPRWRTRLGPVHRAPVFTADGGRLLVPSTDHHLYALDPATGATRWTADLGAPLAGDLAFAEVDDEPRLFLAVGSTVRSLDLSGREEWSADLNGICGGRPE